MHFILLAALLPASSPDFFEMRIRPLLAKNCWSCHTTATRLGNLQLDSRDNLLRGGKTGPAIVPGDPEHSLLIQAVRRTHPRLRMPPAGPLPEADVADLAGWVKSGAPWPESSPGSNFWAAQPLRKPPGGSIDRLLEARLAQAGLRANPAADKRILLRRVTFDLVGLPPTPGEIDAFLSDPSPDAFAKVIDRLLASPHYGERWGRYWLDLARYTDGKLGAFNDTPCPNCFRYRDWVIQAFNDDLPYDVFVKAQIAGDLLPDPDRYVGGLGFQALGPNADDQVDVTTRTFLGLSVACAQCHDHKYDPIPTKDYYSLLGVFRSSEHREYPLVPEPEVKAYQDQEKKIEAMQESIDEFVQKQNSMLAEILGAQTSRYLVAVYTGATAGDAETLERWRQYLKDSDKEHPYLKPWFELVAAKAPLDEVTRFADAFQSRFLAVLAEKKGIDDRNYVLLGGAKGVKVESIRQYANLEFLDVEKYYLWRDLASEPYRKTSRGIYYYGAKDLGRFLAAEFRDYLDSKLTELDRLKKALPKKYPFLETLRDKAEPKNVRVAIRGEAKNLGDEAPRGFLSCLTAGDPAPFTKGSGRLELAAAIASHPLAARVMANRIWELHFGQGLVRTPSNFGRLGDTPSHPDLLDYLAVRFQELGFSVKALHREILLSAAYQRSTGHNAAAYDQDPENRLLWRGNLRPRLDAEALRDALLAVAGNLDPTPGGPAAPLDDRNRRRTLYGYISRSRPDPLLAMFDFPDPNNTSEQRITTNSPLQRLFFLNSTFVAQQAKAVADRLAEASPDDRSRIQQAYVLLYSRPARPAEIDLGLEFLEQTGGAWSRYAQVLLSSNEFSAVN